MRSSGCGPPDQEMPPGVEPGPVPQVNPAATRSAAAPPGLQDEIFRRLPPTTLKAPLASLKTVEYSPALANRKEVPQEPLRVTPASSLSSQVKANLGLLVPPTIWAGAPSWPDE